MKNITMKQLKKLVNEARTPDWRNWFDDQGTLIGEIPEECIRELTAPGEDATDDATKWVRKLGFAVPVDYAEDWIGSWGADIDTEDLSEESLAVYILWDLCSRIREERLDWEDHEDEYVEEYGQEEFDNHQSLTSGFYSIAP